jgi:SPP1 gp7 family putative phage head morphogenesis protein
MTMPSDNLDQSALEWIETRSLLLAKSMNKTTLDALRLALKEGFELGESIPQLTKRLESYFSEAQKYRAEMIARTEVISALNEGALDRYSKENIKEVEFLASPDACSECSQFDAQLFNLSDSHGFIPVHPNCRCSWLAEI